MRTKSVLAYANVLSGVTTGRTGVQLLYDKGKMFAPLKHGNEGLGSAQTREK